MTAIINFLNTVFWGYVLIYGLIAVGIYFTVRLQFQQVLHFGEMIRSIMAAPASLPFRWARTMPPRKVGAGERLANPVRTGG